MWGLYWVPVRFFQSLGLAGPWPGIVMYAAALIAVLPFLIASRDSLRSNWRVLVYSGLFTGSAFSLFTTSLVYTDVVRSILLFYLTPIWGTLLGLIFLGERLGPRRIFGLIAGLGGLFVGLGEGGTMPWPQNTGDWLALISGITWALGSLGLYKTQGSSVVGQVGAFLVGAILISGLSIAVNWGENATSLAQIELWPVLPYVVLSALFVVPMIFLTIWPATLLTPARVGLLLMSEVIVGFISAGLFAGEPFGWREMAGAVLIVSAALIEVSRG